MYHVVFCRDGGVDGGALARFIEQIKRGFSVSQQRISVVGPLVLAVVVPVLFFVLLEAVLRWVFPSDAVVPPFIEVPGQADYLAVNPALGGRYFSDFTPSIAFHPFRKDKGDRFRVVVLGGSSAAGFPYPFYYSLADRLEQKLQVATPGIPIEVINLGMSAVSSAVLRDLMSDVRAIEPDVVMIYAGHNEFYGAGGVAAAEGTYAAATVGRLVYVLRRTHTFAWLEQLIGSVSTAASQAEAEGDPRTLMARMVQDRSISLDGDAYQSALARWSDNVRAILSGAEADGHSVVLFTVPARLLGQAPLDQRPEHQSVFDAGLGAYREGRLAEAQRLLSSARDLDGVRFRASAAMGDVTKAAWGVSDRSNDGTSDVWMIDGAETRALVDAQTLYEQPQALVHDDVLFTDHLHPTALLHDALAGLAVDALYAMPAVRERLGPWAGSHSPAPPIATVTFGAPAWEGLGDEAFQRELDLPVLMSAVDSASARLQVARLRVGYPFTSLTPEEEITATRLLLSDWENRGGASALAVRQLSGMLTHQQALLNALEASAMLDDRQEQLRLWYNLSYWQPFNAGPLNRIRELADLNDPVDRAVLIQVALRRWKVEPSAYLARLLGALLLEDGRITVAGQWLDHAESNGWTDATVLYNQARRFARVGDSTRARDYLIKLQAIQAGSSPGALPH